MRRRVALVAAALLAISAAAPGESTAPSELRVPDPSLFRVFVAPTSAPAAIIDVSAATPAPTRPVAEQPEVKPKVEKKAVAPITASHTASGVPTYYCRAGSSRCTRGYPDVAGLQMYAAAGPSLRVGKWRGRVVNVTANGKTIQVKLIDWCACGGDHFIDLYYDAFKTLGFPSRATVSW